VNTYDVHGGAVLGTSDVCGNDGIPDALTTDSDGWGDDVLLGDGFSSGLTRRNGNGRRTRDADRTDRNCGG